jgi:putative SOS response-associated peptidase YedK
MCNRFTAADLKELEQLMMDLSEQAWEPVLQNPRYNIAPQSNIVTIAHLQDRLQASLMRWGLVPHFEKDEKPRYTSTNATVKKLMTSSAFRQPTQRRRCLVPADGFYEWEPVGDMKLPWYFRKQNKKAFFFAGIFENETNGRPKTVAIVTTEPHALTLAIKHPRSPVMLDIDEARRWLAPGDISADEVNALCAPYDAAKLESFEVSRYVSNSRNEGPDCLERAKPRGKLVAETSDGNQLSLL